MVCCDRKSPVMVCCGTGLEQDQKILVLMFYLCLDAWWPPYMVFNCSLEVAITETERFLFLLSCFLVLASTVYLYNFWPMMLGQKALMWPSNLQQLHVLYRADQVSSLGSWVWPHQRHSHEYGRRFLLFRSSILVLKSCSHCSLYSSSEDVGSGFEPKL